jgi:hypothetical protein
MSYQIGIVTDHMTTLQGNAFAARVDDICFVKEKDTIGYWRGMRSMKQAYAHGAAIYDILCFEKP